MDMMLIFGLCLNVTAYNQFLCIPTEPDGCALLYRKHISRPSPALSWNHFDSMSQMLCAYLNLYLVNEGRPEDVCLGFLRRYEALVTDYHLLSFSTVFHISKFPSTPSVLWVEVLRVNICGLSVISSVAHRDAVSWIQMERRLIFKDTVA